MRFFLLLVAIVLYGNSSVVAQDRTKLSFNAYWKLHIGDVTGAEQPSFGDGEWKTVTLPHVWNEDEAFARPIHEHSTAVVWYRRTFTLPAGVPHEKVFLEFEGVRHGTEFFVNGTWIGRHENGLLTDSLSWEVSPISENNGFFVKNSGIGLPLNLDRGTGVLSRWISHKRLWHNGKSSI